MGCRKAPHELETSTHLPILEADLGLHRIEAVEWEADTSGVLRMRLEASVYRFGIDEFWRFPDTSFQKNVSLKTLSLGTRSVVHRLTLGQIARGMGTAGLPLLLAHGTQTIIPPFNDVGANAVEIDITEMFEEAKFISGKLYLTVHNGLPLDLHTIVFEVRNRTLGDRVIADTIPYLAAGGFFVDSYDLAGKRVEGRLLFELLSMSSPGSNGPVLVDTNDAVTLTLQGRNMYVEEATAVFPSQNFVDDSLDVYYHLDPIRLAYAEIASGKLDVEAVHTMPDSMFFYLSLPGVRDVSGRPMNVDWALRPSPTRDSVRRYEVYSLEGYSVDFTGQYHDTFNSFYQITVLRFDSTGKKVHLSLRDSIYLRYRLLDMRPAYARGYMGKDTISAGGAAEFPWLRRLFDDGWIRFEEVEAGVLFENTFGFDADILIQGVSGWNSFTRRYAVLNGPIIGTMYRVPAATDRPLTPGRREVRLSSDGSNLVDFLAEMPDRIEVTGTVFRNPSGDPERLTDFFYDSSYFDVKVWMEAPLRLSMRGLRLVDTLPMVQFSMEEVDSVRLLWRYVNDYPVKWAVQVYAWDSADGRVVDSLFARRVVVSAAQLKDGGAQPPLGRVFTPASHTGFVTLDPELARRMQAASHWIVDARARTAPDDRSVVLYSDYRLRLVLYGQAYYRLPFGP